MYWFIVVRDGHFDQYLNFGPISGLCDDIDCQNGGTCANGLCECADGFTGETCETGMLYQFWNRNICFEKGFWSEMT